MGVWSLEISNGAGSRPSSILIFEKNPIRHLRLLAILPDFPLYAQIMGDQLKLDGGFFKKIILILNLVIEWIRYLRTTL